MKIISKFWRAYKTATSLLESLRNAERGGLRSEINFTRIRLSPSRSETYARYVDVEWYRSHYSDIRLSGVDPISHYVSSGMKEGRKPNRYFDPSDYAARYPDVRKSEALLHWVSFGSSEGRMPHPLFDTDWYKKNYLLGDTEIEPFLHYLEQGERDDLQPHPDFFPVFYKEQLAKDGITVLYPIEHYLRGGLDREYSPSPLFDVEWYLNRYTDARISGKRPFLHYLTIGRPANRLPNPWADEAQASVLLRAVSPKLDPYHAKLLSPQENRRGLFVGHLKPVRSLCSSSPSTKNGRVQSYHAPISFCELIAGTRILIKEGQGIYADEWSDTHLTLGVTQKYRDVWHIDDGRYAVGYKLKNNTSISNGIHMMAEADYNYYHFITEVLAKTINFDEIDPSIPMLISAGLPKPFLSALRLAGSFHGKRPAIELERGVLYQVDQLTYVGDTARLLDLYSRQAAPDEFYVDEQALAALRRRIVSAVGVNADAPRTRKLYLKRSSSYRCLLNEDHIIAHLIEQGFEIVAPETLSFEAQVRLFSQATLVVAPTGAALTNLLWCGAGTKAVILYSDSKFHQQDLWMTVARPAGVSCRLVYGPRANKVSGLYEVHDDFSIDTTALDEAINE